MTTPLCAGCERPAHDGPCYPEIVGPLLARIEELKTEASEAAMVAAVGEAVIAALRGEEVSDFMQSFGPVMEAQTAAHTIALLHGDVEAQRRVIVDACAYLRVTDDDEADWPKLPIAVLQVVAERDNLRTRIADLDRQLAAAVTHPLAVEMVTRLRTACTAGSCGPGPSQDELAATAIEAWRDGGCPFRVGEVADVG